MVRSFRVTNEEEPKLPDVSEQAEILASLAASDAVVEALAGFNERRRAFTVAIGYMESVRAASHPTLPAAAKAMRERAQQLMASAEVVHQLLRQE